MQFVIKDLVKNFSATTGIECEIIISSSGKLTAQINEGAPFDVFVSANLKYPNDLYKKGLTIDQPKIYAFGKLVLWTMKEDLSPLLFNLTNENIKHIAIPNPKTAPYGKAAMEALNFVNLLEKTKDKLVYGESISQVNQFINSQVVEVGFTSLSVVTSPQIKGKGTYKIIDDSYYHSIAQGIVCIKSDTPKEKNALKFSDYLFSEKGKEILNTFGYSTK
jgi:molybdate transport system substrate-binding protein